MKRRNRVLEILACTALAAVVFWGYMLTAQNNNVFEIEDIEGDRAHLAEFAFEGVAGDEMGQIYFVWQNGALETEYYPGSLAQADDVLYQRKIGKNTLSQYFATVESIHYLTPDLEAAPSADASVQTYDKLEKLPAELREEIEQDVWGRGEYELKAALTDSIDIYSEVVDSERQKVTRFFTGLRLTGKDLYFTEVEYNRGSTRFNSRNYTTELGISSVDLGDAWYTILHTDENCEGEVYLQRIPKDGMLAYRDKPEEVWNELYSDETYGEAEIVKTFAVNAENRIISMEKAGKDRLLLAVTEGDDLFLELYDLEGNLLHRLDAGVPQVSIYELDDVTMIQREDQLLLWFGLARREYTNEIEENSYHYVVDETKYYAIEQDQIRPLQAKDYQIYVDAQGGKILQIKGFAPEHLAADLFGYMYVGYDILVTEEATGETLYHGRLVTDFEEDYNRRLTAVNIGQRAEPIKEREERVDWSRYNEVNRIERNVGALRPIEGWYTYTSWRAGYDWGFTTGDYYYH